MAGGTLNGRWFSRGVSNRTSQVRASCLLSSGWPSFSGIPLHRTFPSTDAGKSTVATGLGRNREARECSIIETPLSMVAQDQKQIGFTQEMTSEDVPVSVTSQADMDENLGARAEQWVVVDPDNDDPPSNNHPTDDFSELSLENQTIYDGVVYQGGFNEESSHISGSEIDTIRPFPSISRKFAMFVHPTSAAAVMDAVDQCNTDLATTAARQDEPEQASNESTCAGGLHRSLQSDRDLTEDDADFLEWIFVEQETELRA